MGSMRWGGAGSRGPMAPLSVPFCLRLAASIKRSYQFFSVRMVCESWGRAMDITWLRSLLTKDWKLGWPRYPGSREKRGLEVGPAVREMP